MIGVKETNIKAEIVPMGREKRMSLPSITVLKLTDIRVKHDDTK